MHKRSEKMCCRLPYKDSLRIVQAAAATKRTKSELMRDALMREVEISLDCANTNDGDESQGQ